MSISRPIGPGGAPQPHAIRHHPSSNQGRLSWPPTAARTAEGARCWRFRLAVHWSRCSGLRLASEPTVRQAACHSTAPRPSTARLGYRARSVVSPLPGPEAARRADLEDVEQISKPSSPRSTYRGTILGGPFGYRLRHDASNRAADIEITQSPSSAHHHRRLTTSTLAGSARVRQLTVDG
jgi:hypothetical protein